MKYALSFALLTCLPCIAVTTYAEPSQKLPAHRIQVAAAHLTTRIEWQTFPQLNYNNHDLKDSPRSAVVKVQSDEQGQIRSAHIQDSTGLQALDTMLLNAVKTSRVKPHMSNGMTVPIIGYQVFNFKLTTDAEDLCQYPFASKQWQLQQKEKQTDFKYLSQPILTIDPDDLSTRARNVKFKIHTDKQHRIDKVKILKSSGISALDQALIHELKGTKIATKRLAKTLWLYKPSSFKDEMQFKVDFCTS